MVLGVIEFLGFGMGGYHGFMDSQGQPLPQEWMEPAATYGPAATAAGLYGLIGGGVGGLGGTTLGGVVGLNLESFAAGGCTGALLGTTVGAGLGTVTAGGSTLIGYGLGYFVGGAFSGQ